MFNTPILFIVFNRIETTVQVFNQIKKIKPNYLYIAADGARENNEGEKQKCDAVREYIISNIDWDCEVKTLFRSENLGCGKGPASAIDWFFENVERGIILEDDCLPNITFFNFCEIMLEKFENVSEIMHISGNNFQLSRIGKECFYLSKLPHIWGWATWKRAWKHYDFFLNNFNEDNINDYFNYPSIDNYWINIFRQMKKEKHPHTWDYQWVFSLFLNNGFSVAPQHNLVTNIGFGESSTHTSNKDDFLSNLKNYEMDIAHNYNEVSYNTIPDINFHQLLKWEKIIYSSQNITAKQAIYIIIKKIKLKFFNF